MSNPLFLNDAEEGFHTYWNNCMEIIIPKADEEELNLSPADRLDRAARLDGMFDVAERFLSIVSHPSSVSKTPEQIMKTAIKTLLGINVELEISSSKRNDGPDTLFEAKV